MVIWIGGLCFLPQCFLLLAAGWTNTALLLLTMAALCYIGPIPSSRTLESLRAWVNGSHKHMFRKTSLTFEDETWRDGAFNGKNPIMAAYHPHGIFSWGFFLHGGLHDDIAPLTGIIAQALCLQPFFRFVFMRCWSVIGSASKGAFVARMKKRESFALLPGGFHEASVMEYGKDCVYLKKRSGFVKYALQYGYRVVPVYTFGETETYWSPAGGVSWRHMLNDYDIPSVFPVGKWWCWLLPREDCEIHTVMGKPIQLPKIDQPSREEVDHWHAIYMNELQAVFNRNKKWASRHGDAAQLEFC